VKYDRLLKLRELVSDKPNPDGEKSTLAVVSHAGGKRVYEILMPVDEHNLAHAMAFQDVKCSVPMVFFKLCPRKDC
jgi:hypothetical protein